MITRQQVAQTLQSAGLKRGDHLFVHSSLRSVGPIDGGGEALIDAMLDTVGDDGTLAMPTFNYSRPQPTPYFDPQHTPGRTGALTEMFRKRPGTVRSMHPTHSIAAAGDRAAEFVADHLKFPAFGVGSPLDRIAQAGGWVLLIGVTHTSNSTIHVGESHAGVTKFWWEDGDMPLVNVKLSDGRIVAHQLDTSPSCSAAFNAIEHPMRRSGLIHDLKIGDATSYLMRGRDVIDMVVRMVAEKFDALMCTGSNCRPCTLGRRR